MKKASGLLLVLFLLTNIGCKKESEVFVTATVNDYSPLHIGKSLLYRLDSTVLSAFGTALTVHSYQALDSVESTFTDTQGRLSYRIFRFIRDTAGLKPWQFGATYVATPTAKSLEYIDNNLRFIKLHAPFTDGYNWKGNAFIDTKSLNSTVSYLDEWRYEYKDIAGPYKVFNTTYDSTVTISQQNETTPNGPFNPANYQQRNLGVEVYATGVGLIYREFMHWTWQTTPAPAKFEDGSYGVKLQLLQHN